MRVYLLALLLAVSPFGGHAWAQGDGGIDIDIGDGKTPPEDSKPDDKKKTPAKPERPTARPRREKGVKVKWVAVHDARGVYSIKLPEDWVLEPAGAREAVLGYKVLLPGSERPCPFFVYERSDMSDPRRMPVLWHKPMLEQLGGDRAEVVIHALPVLAIHYQREGKPQLALFAFRRLRGMGFYGRMDFPESEAAEARPDFLKAVASFTARIDLWPTIPAAYKCKTKGRYLYAIHPGVKGSLRPIMRVVARQEKRFVKAHGKLPRARRDSPTVIYVHRSKSQAGAILKAAGESPNDFYVDQIHARLFAISLSKGDVDRAGLLAASVQELLYLLKYGTPAPFWAYVGESIVARGEQVTGKPLPSLHEGLANWGNQLALGRLDALPAIRKDDWESFSKQAFFYVCLFRAGPSKYRKAYKAMLGVLDRTCDGDAALKALFDAIDPAQAQSAAIEFMHYKIKSVKPD